MKSKIVNCHDCKKEIKNGDEHVKYKTSQGDFYKCKKCHKVDSVLRDYNDCEVYARIVGYYSPKNRWNKGKLEEDKQKVNFKLDNNQKPLTLRDFKILEMRFGLHDGLFHTLEEVGNEFGVTRERIRQMETRVLETLGFDLPKLRKTKTRIEAKELKARIKQYKLDKK